MYEIVDTDNIYDDKAKKVVLMVKEVRIISPNDAPVVCNRVNIISILGGKGEIAVDSNSPTECVAGDVFVMNVNQSYRISKSDGLSVYILSFSFGDFINDNLFIYDQTAATCFVDGISNLGSKIDHINENAGKITELIYDIKDEFTKKNKCSEIVIKTQLILIISLIIQYMFGDSGIVKKEKNEHFADIERTVHYINEHISEEMTLDSLAKCANMSKSSYSAMFKKVTGMTVWNYILKTRVELAVEYLTVSNKQDSITQIAELSGFNDSAYFTRIFKKITGKTPKEIKKENVNSCFFSD